MLARLDPAREADGGKLSTPGPTYFVLGSRAGGCRGPWALPAEPGLCVRVSAPSPPSPYPRRVRFLRGAGPGRGGGGESCGAGTPGGLCVWG